jgi:hypothetical protein
VSKREPREVIQTHSEPLDSTGKPFILLDNERDIELLTRYRKTRRKPPKVSKQEDSPNFEIKNAGSHEATVLQLYASTGQTVPAAAAKLLGQLASAIPEAADEESINAALAMMDEIRPSDGLEGLLAAQMTVTHASAMEFSRRMNAPGASVEAVERNMNRVNKLMGLFLRQMDALQRHRQQGEQTIQVQHIQVSQGGQAIVGNVQTGRG